MAFRSYTLILSGAPQRLSDVYGGAAGGQDARTDIPYRALYFQGRLANTGAIYLGMDQTVSSTLHGFRLGAADTDLPFALEPASPGSPLHLSDFWVIGSAGEALTVGGIPL